MATTLIESKERLEKLGFRRGAAGRFIVRETEICVVIVVERGYAADYFGVYMTHGTPGGAFWRNGPPLVRCLSLVEAKGVAERLYGIAGSGEMAEIVDR